MDRDKILKLIGQGESERVEFKSSFKSDTIIAITAFANAKGGTVLVGVGDTGEIVGVTLGKESLQNYINQIKQNTKPSLVVDIQAVQIEHKTILYIKINEFPIKPVAYRDRFYKRVQNSNHLLTPHEITDLHLSSLQLSWDSYLSQQGQLQDLDKTKIRKFIQKVNENKRFTLSEEPYEALEKLHMIQKDRPTNAAMLLFAKEQTVYNIHIGRFKTASHIIDDKMIQKTLYEAVEETMKYLISWLKVAFEISTERERVEIFEYPLPALRELILNAVIHRDYTSPIDTQIKIFDQKITIFNPGKLYGDITIEDLKTDTYQAQTRNKLIAEAFYLTHDIEKYGSGYIRVREEIKTYPTMKFEYKEMGNGYLVTLSYVNQKVHTKIDEGVDEGVNEGVNEGVKSLYLLIQKYPNKKTPFYAKELNTSVKNIERWIRKLKDEEKVAFVGSPKTGGYIAK